MLTTSHQQLRAKQNSRNGKRWMAVRTGKISDDFRTGSAGVCAEATVTPGFNGLGAASRRVVAFLAAEARSSVTRKGLTSPRAKGLGRQKRLECKNVGQGSWSTWKYGAYLIFG